MEHFTVLVAPGKCRICSGTHFIFQRFPQHYLPSDLFFLQFDFWHFYQEVWLMFSPLKLSGLFWLFHLTEYYRNDTMWFLKLDHKRQCSFIFFCWKARLDCETCSHYVSSPAVLRPSCCEARPQGRALSLPDPLLLQLQLQPPSDCSQVRNSEPGLPSQIFLKSWLKDSKMAIVV